MAVIRIEENEKFLVLRKKYRPPDFFVTSPVASPSNSEMGSRMFFNTPAQSPTNSPRQPPPYRPPPPADTPPVVPPRRRSSTPKYEPYDEMVTPQRRRTLEEDSNRNEWEHPKENIPMIAVDDAGDAENELKISVKERMQKFNRMASESDGPKLPVSPSRKRLDKVGDFFF